MSDSESGESDHILSADIPQPLKRLRNSVIWAAGRTFANEASVGVTSTKEFERWSQQLAPMQCIRDGDTLIATHTSESYVESCKRAITRHRHRDLELRVPKDYKHVTHHIEAYAERLGSVAMVVPGLRGGATIVKVKPRNTARPELADSIRNAYGGGSNEDHQQRMSVQMPDGTVVEGPPRPAPGTAANYAPRPQAPQFQSMGLSYQPPATVRPPAYQSPAYQESIAGDLGPHATSAPYQAPPAYQASAPYQAPAPLHAPPQYAAATPGVLSPGVLGSTVPPKRPRSPPRSAEDNSAWADDVIDSILSDRNICCAEYEVTYDQGFALNSRIKQHKDTLLLRSNTKKTKVLVSRVITAHIEEIESALRAHKRSRSGSRFMQTTLYTTQYLDEMKRVAADNGCSVTYNVIEGYKQGPSECYQFELTPLPDAPPPPRPSASAPSHQAPPPTQLGNGVKGTARPAVGAIPLAPPPQQTFPSVESARQLYIDAMGDQGTIQSGWTSVQLGEYEYYFVDHTRREAFPANLESVDVVEKRFGDSLRSRFVAEE